MVTQQDESECYIELHALTRVVPRREDKGLLLKKPKGLKVLEEKANAVLRRALL